MVDLSDADKSKDEATANQSNLVLAAATSHKFLILSLICLGLWAGYELCQTVAPSYASYAKVLVQRTFSNSSVDPGEKESPREPVDIHAYLLTQPLIVDRAVTDGRLLELPPFAGSTQKQAVGIIRQSLSAKQNKFTPNVIELAYVTSTPSDAKTVLEAVLNAYREWLNETQGKETGDAYNLIVDARKKLDEDLADYQKRYAAFRARAKLLFQGEKGVNKYEGRLAQTEKRRQDVLLEQAELLSRLEAIDSALQLGKVSRESLLLLADVDGKAKGDGKVERERVLNSPSATPWTNQIYEAILERERLLRGVGEGHPQVKAVDSKISTLKRFVEEQSAGKDGSDAKQDLLDIKLASLRERIKGYDEELAALDRLFQDDEKKAKELAAEQVEERLLEEEAAQHKRLFEAVLQKLQDVDIARSHNLYKAQVVDLPNIGVQVSPITAAYVGGGGAIGLLTGLAFATLLRFRDKRFRSSDEIASFLGLPVLGHVPTFGSSRSDRVRIDDIVDVMIATHHRPQSRAAEAYRGIRAALFFSARNSKKVQVLQVTSAQPGDGKSTMAANLAVAVATSGKRCLLVDADVRRPRVHELMGISNGAGLSSLLSGACELADAIVPTAQANLDAIPAGPPAKHHAEVLLSPLFTDFITLVRDRYDFIIIDTPPVLAVSDPSVVAVHSDGVLLLVHPSRHARSATRKATDVLSIIGAPVVGVVVNQIDLLSGDYDVGYGYYSGKYGYSSHGKRSERGSMAARAGYGSKLA